jgi:hypothetical protein
MGFRATNYLVLFQKIVIESMKEAFKRIIPDVPSLNPRSPIRENHKISKQHVKFGADIQSLHLYLHKS